MSLHFGRINAKVRTIHAPSFTSTHNINMLDQFDLSILSLLQQDARLTNNELSEKVNLSASQCSRRRTRLEDEGLIAGYHARLDREKVGLGIVTIINVTLATHNPDNSKRFAALISNLPEVQEAHALTGEMDYFIKVVAKDLNGPARLR